MSANGQKGASKVEGLSTDGAMEILCGAIERELTDHLTVLNVTTCSLRYYFSRESVFHPSHSRSVLHWPGIIMLCLCILVLLLVCFVRDRVSPGLIAEVLVVTLLFLATLVFLIRDDCLKKHELATRLKKLLALCRECHSASWWTVANFVNLHTPITPCISLQWVLRDGETVNVNTCLLVEGDVIVMRPGQAAVARCIDCDKGEEELDAGDVYCPQMLQLDSVGEARVLQPLQPRCFRLLETPLSKHLRHLLSHSHQRPVSVIDNEMYAICSQLVEMKVVPIWLGVMLVVNLVRWFIVDASGRWYEMALQLPVECILPLTAVVFPLLWRLLDLYGNARLLAAFETVTKFQEHSSDALPESSTGLERPAHLAEPVQTASLRDEARAMVRVMLGTADCLPRSTNPLHGLASVTDVSCIDKKGIIAWPNPSVEKVFFVRNRLVSPFDEGAADGAGTFVSGDSGRATTDVELNKKDKKGLCPEHSFEVLSLTPDQKVIGDSLVQQKDGYRLQFDDVTWKKHMASLKPLGLDILLNTCNMSTTESYTEFADHITCASLSIEETVPVVNRRCFCELSTQIGFTNQATDIFQVNNVFGVYRSVSSDTVQLPLPYQTRTSGRYKMPLPNVFSVIAREGQTGSLHLFSQGTGDLLLDLCSDFWNGRDLCQLQAAERKKISDFYHRTSLTSYCMAFAYRPITQVLADDPDNFYIELPEDPTYLSSIVRYPSQSTLRTSEAQTDAMQPHLSYHGSADSLITGTSLPAVGEPDCYLRLQCNQVFIGMITMQYQAMQDVVRMVEELETCCIRFVHFSKENELRSRVFSEKMGLEAGWNCHISLLAEKAPGGGGVGDGGVGVAVTCDSLPGSLPQSRSASISRRSSRFPSKQSTDSVTAPTATDVATTVHSRACSPRRANSAPANINLDIPLVKFEAVTEVLGDDDNVRCNALRPPVTEEPVAMGPAGLPKARVSDVVLGASSKSGWDRVGGEESKPLLKSEFSKSESRKLRREPTRYNETAGDPLLECSDVPQASDSMPDDIESTDSYPESSHQTENTDSVTGGLGLSNRARLPRGIDNIRPHIETVDNVPLLVSLFTDCTPETTCEMNKILQEYGEVVLCLGSTLTLSNMAIFTQADVSVGLDPISPQVCSRCSPCEKPRASAAVSPTDMASSLCSLPCAFRFRRQCGLSVILHLITLARQHTDGARNVALLLLTFSLTLTLLQSVACVALLPPVLSSVHVMWLTVVCGPVLALSTMATPLDPNDIKRAPEKNKDHVPRKTLVQYVICHMIVAMPTVAVCLLCHFFTLASFCADTVPVTNASDSCGLFSFSDANVTEPWNDLHDDLHAGLILSQNFVAFQFVVYLVVWSASCVHRYHHIWRRLPFTNKLWSISALAMILSQVVFALCHVAYDNRFHVFKASLSDVPLFVQVTASVWPLVLLSLNEAVKWKFIRQSIRYQKRARLDFGTKLGMNSPF